MRRRRFEHLFGELSVRTGRLAPRYALWLRLRELELDPDWLAREDVLWFCRRHLDVFLREHGLQLAPRSRRALLRAVASHDPSLPTPSERVASW